MTNTTTSLRRTSSRTCAVDDGARLSGVRSLASTLPLLITLFFIVLSGTFPAQQSRFNIVDYGAKGDGKTVNTSAINQAIAACAKAGGGTVHVPVGEFRSGTVVLLSNVNLHLDSGAVLKGSDDLGDYVKEGEILYGLILARKAENVAITGHGILDGNGTYFMDLNKKRVEDDFDGKFTRQGKAYILRRPGTG